MFLHIVAWGFIGVSIFSILFGPFLIGKEKSETTWTAGSYVFNVIFGVLLILVCMQSLQV